MRVTGGVRTPPPPKVPASEGPQTHALDQATAGFDEERNYSEKIMSKAISSVGDITWTVPGSKQNLRVEGSATDCLSHGTAIKTLQIL